MKVISILLSFGVVFIAMLGLTYLTQATQGVGIIAFAGVIGVLARIFQAEANYEAIRKKLNSLINSEK
jgi:hypothetical protein